MKRRQLLRAAIACGALSATGPGWAKSRFPDRPVKIVVPFPPGALTDTLARLLASKLWEKWQQPVVVENRAGASGNIGTEWVYRSAPDGYTLLFTPQSTLTLSKLLTPQMQFDPATMTPIAMVTRSTVLMLANPKVPAQTVPELIAYARAHPGKLNYASPGVGSTSQLANDLFFKLSKTDGMNVPYQGIAQATNALLAGDVDVLFDAMGNSLGNVRSGRLKALAVASDSRNPALPGVATVAETLPGFVSPLWTGVAAPPGTPPALAAQISEDIAQVLRRPDIVAYIGKIPGLEAVGGTPGQMQQTMKREHELWVGLIKLTESTGG
jgi:tripartite-type tricarboxylate transporter receptor subunit TctC